MDLLQAIEARHSVRAYVDKPLEASAVEVLKAKVAEVNAAAPGLHVQLVLDEPKAFASPMAKYGKFSGCSNYFVMAGKPLDGNQDAFKENVGYYGELLVLEAQRLGLNTCWVGLTYGKVEGAFSLEAGETVECVISLGYGATQGVQHRGKTAEQISNVAETDCPDWFKAGVEAVLKAPTAVNQQRFFFEYKGDGKVEARKTFSMIGYTWTDLGIAKLHFEIAAGKDNFTWA